MENNNKKEDITLDDIKTPKVYTSDDSFPVSTRKDELKSEKLVSEVGEVEISEIAEYAKPEPKDSVLDEGLKELDDAIAGLANRSIEFNKERIEKEAEKAIEEEISDEFEEDSIEDEIKDEIEEEISDEFEEEDLIENEIEENKNIKIINNEEEKEIKNSKVKKEEKNIDTLIDEEVNGISEEDNEEEKMNSFKSSIKNRIKPVVNKIDLSSFSISKNPVSVNTTLKSIPEKIYEWGLFDSNLPITLKEFKGYDIDDLNIRNYQDRYKGYKKIYSTIFDHVIDEGKPSGLERWLKRISFYDIPHLFFAIYIASFKDSNYIPYTCPHCEHTFISDHIPVEKMVKYKNDKVKDHAKEVMSLEYTDINSANQNELVQVSDDYVIEFRMPSIFNIILENAILDSNFTEKYTKMLTTLSFIEKIYRINRETSNLDPIDCKVYPNNIKKTAKYKIVTYSKILQSLNSDQVYYIDEIVNKLGEGHDDISYVLPEIECPKCKEKIEEVEMGSEELLFIRHQLIAISNS